MESDNSGKVTLNSIREESKAKIVKFCACKLCGSCTGYGLTIYSNDSRDHHVCKNCYKSLKEYSVG